MREAVTWFGMRVTLSPQASCATVFGQLVSGMVKALKQVQQVCPLEPVEYVSKVSFAPETDDDAITITLQCRRQLAELLKEAAYMNEISIAAEVRAIIRNHFKVSI